MTATIVRTADLRQALRVILPFAERGGVMDSVHLEADRWNLVATASDRYVLGHLRVMAGGDPLISAVLPRRAAKLVIRALNEVPDDLPAHLRRIRKLDKPTFLEVSTDVMTIRVKVFDVDYPKVAKLFAQADEKPSGLSEPINLDPARARPFAKVAKALGVRHVRWTFHGQKHPARVEIGRTFVGLAMPGIHFPDDYDPSPVPVGLASASAGSR